MTETMVHYTSASVADVALATLPSELAHVLETTERLLRRSNSSGRFRSQRGNPGIARQQSIWPAFVELGLSGMCTPSRLGGGGLEPGAAVLVAELIGRSLAPEPFVACSVFPTSFLGLANSPAADALLQAAARGVAMPVMAIGGGERPAAVLSVAGQTAMLRGAASFVHGAAWATHYIVTAMLDGETCAVVVPASAPKLQIVSEELADGSMRARLAFEDIELDRASIVSVGPACDEIVAAAADWTNIALSAELFGVQCALFDMTIAYLKTRRQFDRFIGSFQALQHRAADLYCGKEIARFVIAEAIGDMADASTRTERSLIASRCKARASASALAIGREAVQMHGAMGFSDECDVGLYLKRTLVLSAWLGGVDFHRRRVAQLGLRLAS